MDNDRDLRLKLFEIVEGHIFIIAILIIVLIGVLLIINFPSKEDNAQVIFTALLTSLGTIVGFYFGQKPFGDAMSQLKATQKELTQQSNITSNAVEITNNYEEDLSQMKKQIKEYEELLSKIFNETKQ
jgi:Tfp pilus assembly protein PilO